MIDLYTWTTPNGRKISIMLEELALPYTVKPVDLGQKAQFDPEFLRISPGNRIPAIVDHDNGRCLMESGAILLYLAEKTGQLMPRDPDLYWQAMEWLMWQMGSIGPMFGQVHHFTRHNPGKSNYAEKRYLDEAHRLYGVLDRRLEGREYLTEDYSLVDIAIWPWVSRFDWQTIDLNAYPNVARWYVAISRRPAVQRGYHVPHYVNDIPMPDR